MASLPHVSITPSDFAADPYPMLAEMRAKTPICYVPELGAVLLTRRDDVFREEKRVETFSSYQPAGLLQQIMGENMMRKDGSAHQRERKAIFPALSPRTVKTHLRAAFEAIVDAYIAELHSRGGMDVVRDFALPVAADALRVMTGLMNMPTLRMDYCSQAMLDGCANYTADPEIERKAYAASASIDALIDARLEDLRAAPDQSILSVLDRAGVPRDAIAGTIKVIIGGGQNEPRDAIAGTVYALLSHPKQHAQIKAGAAQYKDAFNEYTRWVTPIGMSPRRVARPDQVLGYDLEPDQTVFLMFSSACRDERHFEAPDRFDVTRDTSASIAFGAGPHFCAGAAAARCLIADVALPRLFAAMPDMRLAGDVSFHGWAFRGPLHVPVRWTS